MDDLTKLVEESTKKPERDYSIERGQLSKTFRDRAQVINFEQLNQLLLQDVSRTPNRTFSQYTKALVQGYLQSPMANIDNLRSVSQFLWRVSASYRKIIEYTAQTPLWYYNITYISDWTKQTDSAKFMKGYQTLARRLQKWNIADMGATLTATALRDGIAIGLIYDNEDDGVWMQYLDPRYCKVQGVSNEGNYVVYFNAAFFDVGNNQDFIYGVNEDGEGIWDEVFIEGYETYNSQGRDYQWFQLPIDRTCCLIAGDDPSMPLPYYITIFTDLMDIIDYQSIVRSKTELQNFVLLYSKIPLIDGSKEIDDFALDIDTVIGFNQRIESVVPDLVGVAFGAADLKIMTFKDLNNTDDTDIVADSMHNLFSKIGISEMIFNSDKGGSVGLDASIKIDEAFAMRYVNRFEHWMSAYVTNVIDSDFIFYIHKVTAYNQSKYLEKLEKQITLGMPKHLDWATASGDTPFEIMNKTYMINALDMNTLWQPPQSSWTKTSDGESGGQTKDISDLTPEGQETREKNKNQTEVDT